MPLRITATVINIDRGQHFYDVSFTDVEGQTRNIRLSRDKFHKPEQVVADLMRAGAALSDELKIACQQVKAALSSKSPRSYRVTSQPGWHEGDSVVYPGRTFGKLEGKLLYEPADERDQALGLQAGPPDDWREGLRPPCEASDFLILTISHKAASPLLEIIGQEEGMLLHLHGANIASRGEDKARSSSGKTLATRVAASTTGRCRKNDLPDIRDHRAGHRGLLLRS